MLRSCSRLRLMPARKPPPPDEKPQRQRFIETAREVAASEDPEEFERAFQRVIRCRPGSPEPGGPARAIKKLDSKSLSSLSGVKMETSR
jgi:hypothetical protein